MENDINPVDPGAAWPVLLHAVTHSLPSSWQPRRPQPEWDRAFSGRAHIESAFGAGTDAARTWAVEALAFSETLIRGYDGLENVVQTGRTVLREHGPKGKKQFDS
jgi:hypothetical protein